MKRIFFLSFLTIDPSKTGINSLCAPGIQGSKRCLQGLIESRISRRKIAFRPENTSTKRISCIVKNRRNFTQSYDCISSATAADSRVYITGNFEGSSAIFCFHATDGRTVFFDRNIVRGSFDIAEEMFFILTEFGEIVVAKPLEKNFEVFVRLELPGGKDGQAYSHPIVHGNRMYVRIGPVLYCVE